MTPTLQAAAVQALGVLAALLGVSAFLHAAERAFKLQLGGASCLWGVHFLLLGSPSAAFTQFAIGARTWASLVCRTPRARRALFAASSLAFCALAWAGWDGWISLLPLAAAINSTLALVQAGNRDMRLRLLLSSALWIATGLYWQSWPMVLVELLSVAMNLRTLRRLARRPSASS